VRCQDVVEKETCDSNFRLVQDYQATGQWRKFRKLASEYGVGKSTVSDINSKRDKIISRCSRTECGPGKRQTLRRAENVDVEQALYTLIVQQRAKNNMLSGDIIAEKARFFFFFTEK